MKAHISEPRAFNNAFWDTSTEAIYYGDVDPSLYNPFIDHEDIMVHEFGHAVTQYSSNLEYRGQSGALNESVSDVFAIIMKNSKSNKAANDPEANWYIGEDCIVAEEKTAIRSVKDPGSAYKNHPILGDDRQVKHMNEYKALKEDLENDMGGVHLYSGIPNHAFYLMASEIGGGDWDKVGKIWYNTLIQSSADSNFQTFASKSLSVVGELQFEEGVRNAVGQAWQKVGISLTLGEPVKKRKLDTESSSKT